MPLAECHNQDNKRVVANGTQRVSKPKTGKKVVQWADVIVEEKIIEKYESNNEEESEQPLPSPPARSVIRSSMARRDTVERPVIDCTYRNPPPKIAPSALYSTRSKGLRRLPPSPNPHFDSEQLQNQKLDGCRVRAVMKTELVFDGKTKVRGNLDRQFAVL
ncbi:hypothetical protein PRIPAC_88012 [Pristionchus pacificus]|uniref:Uncharacterized protein n=1 Tax=Pristionchus pacificus TaxID=54126 RepID=A0A2A6B735_PRIPA|nr:hypothetical protein PRIPAC_88012 [Pristionchus pacificus]|eukprot:PDM61663.1 hypothetical protein PRIPAC_51105 [Pristionchus pacificus]